MTSLNCDTCLIILLFYQTKIVYIVKMFANIALCGIIVVYPHIRINQMKETAVYNDLSENINFAHIKSAECNIDIHLHDSCEIFMAMSPNIRYHVEGRAYELDTGDVIITNEKEIHRPLTTGGGIYERRFVQFKPVIFSHFFSKDYNPLDIFEKRQLGQNNKMALSDRKGNPVHLLFDEIEGLYNKKSAKNMLLIKASLVKLLSELEEQYRKSGFDDADISAPDERIEGVIAELSGSFDKPFSLDEISRRHFMDKYYLCHLFKEVTGFSLLEYVQSKRIQQAKMLISQGTGIMEAARLSGFEEYSNFYKTFTKLVKLPPKKYKKSISAVK